MPDAGAMIGEASKLVTQLSDGLTTWARRIEVKPFRLRVIGTAGSGKTQLAIGVLHDAVAAGHRGLYVCYNRPLADHVCAIAPREAHAMTFHQLCEAVANEAGGSAVQATNQALVDALALGYRPADIAVITFQGR